MILTIATTQPHIDRAQTDNYEYYRKNNDMDKSPARIEGNQGDICAENALPLFRHNRDTFLLFLPSFFAIPIKEPIL
jgi:hypothetical protein